MRELVLTDVPLSVESDPNPDAVFNSAVFVAD